MSKKVETYGIIKDKKVHYTRAKEFLALVYQTFKDGDRFRVTFEKLYKKKSNEQNRYLWGAVYPILLDEIRQQGNEMSVEELHLLCKYQFLEKRSICNKNTGETIEIMPTTATLSTSQMIDYIESIRQWSSDFWGCSIPNPGEQTKIEIA